MSGLILLFVLFVYAALVYWIATRFKRAWVRWVIVLVAVFGPFVESTIARIRVASLCRAEFGVHYLRPVTDLDGLYSAGLGTAFPYGEIRNLGIAFQEYPLPDRTGFVRNFIGPGGEELQELIKEPSARYEYRDIEPVWLAGSIKRYERQLVDRENGQVVAYGRQFVYAGDWLSRFLRKSHLPAYSGIDCGRNVSSRDLLNPALKATRDTAIEESK